MGPLAFFFITNTHVQLDSQLPFFVNNFWTLAPDECPDPELDLPFACHDGGMSDAKKDKKI